MTRKYSAILLLLVFGGFVQLGNGLFNRYSQKNPVYYRLRKDPHQIKPPKVTPDNLFGWLNKKNGVKFYLWTRKNPDLAHEIKYNNLESLKTSNFDPQKLTKIVIHGWADGASEVQVGDWIFFMRDAFLQFADVNFIVVDYAVYASWFLYYSAIPDLVAARVAEMIGFLEKNGMDVDPLHVIGWSWGAHVAGMAGHRLKARVGRISGIDPAGPTFRFLSNEYRLDKADGKFVDIMHVNAGLPFIWGYFGLMDALGHIDFYPNGGAWQTGCPRGKTYIYETLWCSHGRGVKYFTESISSPLAFPSCLCESFDKYIRGDCPCSLEETAYMGEHLSSNVTPGVYYLVTRPKFPFGHGIQLNISLPNFAPEKELGRLLEENGVQGPEGTITIQYKSSVTRLNEMNKYNSKSYPNDNILEISKRFVLNHLTKNATDEV